MPNRMAVVTILALLGAPAVSTEPGEPAQFNVGRAQEKITPPGGGWPTRLW